MRRLFIISAVVSLLACILSVLVATWAMGNRWGMSQDGFALARHGWLLIVEREGRGGVMITTMSWPRNEPWVAVQPDSNRIVLTSDVWRHDVWFASQFGGRGFLPWGIADPWNRLTMTTARPMQVPLTFTIVDMWKLATLFGVLPLISIVRRIFGPRRRFNGFEVEQIGPAATGASRPHAGA